MNTLEQSQTERLADDLIFGAEAIAAELGVEPSQIYYIHRMKLLPIGKFGKQLIASRRKLRGAAVRLTTA
jgi:hypothetical protein